MMRIGCFSCFVCLSDVTRTFGALEIGSHRGASSLTTTSTAVIPPEQLLGKLLLDRVAGFLDRVAGFPQVVELPRVCSEVEVLDEVHVIETDPSLLHISSLELRVRSVTKVTPRHMANADKVVMDILSVVNVAFRVVVVEVVFDEDIVSPPMGVCLFSIRGQLFHLIPGWGRNRIVPCIHQKRQDGATIHGVRLIKACHCHPCAGDIHLSARVFEGRIPFDTRATDEQVDARVKVVVVTLVDENVELTKLEPMIARVHEVSIVDDAEVLSKLHNFVDDIVH